MHKTEIPSPPKHWLRFANLLRLGFGIALLLSVSLSLVACGNRTGMSKSRAASGYYSPLRIAQIVKENTGLDTLETMEVSTIMKKQKQRLTWVNFNSPKLCGQWGCAYAVYWDNGQMGERLFAGYLNPNLPKGVPLVEVKRRESEGLPCLGIHQVEEKALRETEYCVQNHSYQVMRTQLMTKKRLS